MSARYFCDVCETEIPESDGDRVRRILGTVMVEIMVRHNGVWNAGHVCPSCVVKVVNDGRPAKENERWSVETA